MKNRQKITRDTVPGDFTLSLVLIDALPVLLFGGSTVLISLLFKSALFLSGALLCFWAGAAKVVWKITVVKKRKNVWWLFLQMRTAMPAGFLLMLLSLVFSGKAPDAAALYGAVTSFPSVIFFAAGLAGILLMAVFSVKLDSADKRSNYVEELTNTFAQLCFFTGIALLFRG